MALQRLQRRAAEAARFRPYQCFQSKQEESSVYV
jgi:hypothetical protein